VPHADDLSHALVTCPVHVPFDGLPVHACAENAHCGSVPAWLGTAVERGLVEDIGADQLDPRRFRAGRGGELYLGKPRNPSRRAG